MVAAAPEGKLAHWPEEARAQLNSLITMQRMRPLFRPLRVTCLRMEREAPHQSQKISMVLENNNLFAELENHMHMWIQDQGQEAMIFAPADPSAATDPTAPAPQRPILNFLWTHRQEILQFILQIVATISGLGGGTPTPAPTLAHAEK